MPDAIPPKKPEQDKAAAAPDKKPVRIRPLHADRWGRKRILKNDKRYVEFY